MTDMERTDDGRYIVVDGRRWRAADPGIPATLQKELVNALMAARRAVRSKNDGARSRVHDAKVALGERGAPWWEKPAPDALDDRIAAALRTLARHRAPGTVCPSEVARVVAQGGEWRPLMERVRAVARRLVTDGLIVVTQKGKQVDASRAVGPVRYRAVSGDDESDPDVIGAAGPASDEKR